MSSYARILRAPLMARLLGATVLARLPIGINGLAIVLFVRAETGSFAAAGAAAGALALGSGLGAPVTGRLIDARGPGLLVGLGVLHALGLGALVTLGLGGAPVAALVGASGLAGLAFPPTSSVQRTLYPRLLAGEPSLIQGAFALDSVLTETLFVVGPLITALLVAFASPASALGVSAAAVLVGTVAFVAAMPPPAPAADGEEGRGRSRLGALASPGIRTLVLAMLPVGFSFGALEVAIPAFADEEGRPELAGVLVAVWALASATGGLAYGARARRSSLVRVHLRVAILMPLGLLPVLLATSPALMALLVLPAGVCIAPLIATRNELAGTVAPRGAETEAYTWPLTALVSGIALGAAAAGVLVDASGWRSAVLAGAAAGAVGAVVSLTRQATLRPLSVAGG